MIRRKDNWNSLLHSFVTERRAMPFQYGKNDCCMYVCDAILEMTGIDIADGIRGHYKTKKGAANILKKGYGVRGIADVIFTKYGLFEVGINFAGRGDPVLFRDNDQDLLGVISTCGRNIVSVAPAGGIFLPRSIAVIAWGLP